MHPSFKDPAVVRKDQLIKQLNVKEIKAYGYTKDGSSILDGKPVIIEKYDKDGELIELYNWLEYAIEIKMYVSFDKFDDGIRTYCYDDLEFHTYNANHKLIERKEYYANKRLKEWRHLEYENSHYGIEVCREYRHKKKYFGKTVSKTDELGNPLFDAYFNELDDPIGKQTYQYDENHRLIKMIRWFVMTKRTNLKAVASFLGLFYSEYRYEYDKNGRLIKDIRFNLDETIDWSHSVTYKYDASDRLIAEINYNESGGSDRITSYEYDANGNLVSRTNADLDGMILSSRKSTFNKNGLEKELVIEQNESNKYVKYLYFYTYHQ
jgi:hypothetical protein